MFWTSVGNIFGHAKPAGSQTAVLKMISWKDSRVMALRVREINGKIKSKDVHA